MDSLTQIVLGAAVGEVVLGKKVGNRALLWGAVGGTIPDLDVAASMFLNPLQTLAAHRGFSHSIVFAILGAFLFGWLIHRLYQSPFHKYFAMLGWFMIPVGVVYFISRIFDNASFSLVSGSIMAVIIIGAFIVLYKRYFKNESRELPDASVKDWQWLMFWAVFTHPLLDCFTTYGTQLFQPFSDYRVGFNTIAVADPFYTLPFLICVIAIFYYHRKREKRRRLAWIGLGISSIYMMLCVFNKSRVNSVWQDTLASSNVTYSRYMTSPSILSNFLWTCVAETDDGYVTGQYSIFDKEPRVLFEKIERNQTDEDLPLNDHTFERMRWFSNDYYTIIDHQEGLQFNDLRFGGSRTKTGERHYIFNFVLKKEADAYRMIGSNGGPPPGEEQEMISNLWKRIKGI